MKELYVLLLDAQTVPQESELFPPTTDDRDVITQALHDALGTHKLPPALLPHQDQTQIPA